MIKLHGVVHDIFNRSLVRLSVRFYVTLYFMPLCVLLWHNRAFVVVGVWNVIAGAELACVLIHCSSCWVLKQFWKSCWSSCDIIDRCDEEDV